jgi:4-aminobutyrate aminotransferase
MRSIATELPGPKARALIALDEAFVSPSYTRSYPLVVENARDVWVEDVDGNVFLDFTAGIAVCATGHCHPRVVQAVQRQAEKLLHMATADFYNRPQIELAAALARLSPWRDGAKVYFGNSGAEAVEAAFKLARWHTKRNLTIAFYGAFHGRTMGALSLTASRAVQKRHYNPLVPGVTHVPYPNCYRCPWGGSQGHENSARSGRCDNCGQGCVSWLRDTVFRAAIPPEEVAAIFVEPVQGEGGYIVPPAEFLQELRRLATEYGILLVADEVQSGMGRTGKMFAMEHFGVQPDMMTLAKGIASGLPLGVMLSRAELMDWEPGSHASTFGGNPVACAAALATIALLEEGLVANAAAQGERLLAGLREIQKRRACIGDVRGLGLMAAIELVRDPVGREPDAELRERVLHAAFRNGLLLLGCGQSAIRFCPALTVTSRHVDECLSVLEDALKEAAPGSQAP